MEIEKEKVVLELFDKIVGKTGFNTTNNYLITKEGNPESILSLLKLCKTLPVNLQLNIINKLCYLLAKSTRNRHLCAHLNLLSVLIGMILEAKEQELFDKCLILIEVVGSFSMSVRQQKELLALLNEGSLSEERKISLVKSIQNITQSKSPRVFFDFDGIISGVKLPDVEKWPSSSYSFSLWLNIENFDEPTGSQFYEPRVFSFLTSAGAGVEVYFLKKTLYLRTNQTNKIALTFNFETNRWYHIVITHSYSAMEWLSIPRSSVKLYVGGKQEAEVYLKYPVISEPIVNCFLGSSIVVDNAFVHIPERKSFYGQIGMFCFFSEALTASQVMELYQLGYNYMPNFHKKDLFTRHGAPKLLQGYSPKASENDTCYNLAHYQSSDKAILFMNANNKKQRHGKLFGTTLVISTSHIKDSVYSASGPQILFPLFYHLSQQPEWQPSPLFINSLVLLLCDLLEEHTSNQMEMGRCNGFQILGSLFEKLPKFLDIHSVHSLDKLIRTVTLSDHLIQEAYSSLMLNFDIWASTEFSVQKQLTSTLLKRVESNPHFFKTSFGVQRFIDILRNYYCYASEESEGTKSPEGRRTLSEDELKAIQLNLLHALALMLAEGIEFEEAQSIIQFLQECTDALQLIGILRLLYDLLSKPVKNLVHHLENLGGIRPLVCLLYKKDEAVKMMDLKVIGKFLQQSQPKAKLKLLQDYGSIFAVDINLTENIYHCLIEILLDDFSLRNPTPQSLLVGDNKKLVNPQILPAIFKMLHQCLNHELQQRAIQEFLLCLTQNRSIFQPFTEQFGWQGWLLNFLAQPAPFTLETSDPNNNTETGEVFNESEATADLVQIFFNRLLREAFFTKEPGWKLLEDTEAFAQLYVENDQFNAEKFIRGLYINLLTSLEKDVIQADHSKTNPLWKNLTNFIILIEEFIFTPSLHRDEDGKWSDYLLVLKVLDVFDYSIRPPDNSHMGTIEISSGKGKDIFVTILRLTLLTFQEAFGYFYGKYNDDESFGNKQDQQTNAEMEKLFYKNVQRVRHLLFSIMLPNVNASTSALDENTKRLMWTLAYTLKTIRRSLKYNDTSNAIIIPLAKEILRNNALVIAALIGNEFSFGSSAEQAYQEGAPASSFIAYMDSVEYYELIKKIEDFKGEYEVNFNTASKVESRREKTLVALKQRVKREIQLEQVNKKKLDSECFSLSQKQRSAEVERRASAALMYSENKRNLKQQWKTMRRDLTNERSCWGKRGQFAYWMLDPTENSMRMRMKLKRNYRGTDHKEASLAYKREQAALKAAKQESEQNASQDSADKPLSPRMEPKESKSNEDILKSLSGIHITVRRNSMDMIEEFDFSNNELEESWYVVDESEDKDSIRIAEKVLFSTGADLINPLTTVEGRFVVSATTLYFFVNRNPAATRQKKDRKWPLESVVDVQKRRHLLRANALEIFLSNHRSYMFTFGPNNRKKVIQVLSKLCPGRVEGVNLSPSELLKKSGLTQQWQRREISNFEYLMRLNTLSGRTYNDLTQYPVFPWILTDYESQSIDINDPKIYRDLSKPIGALNPTRLKSFIERYEAFDDPSIPKFYYGSHYSTMGSVLYFLIRMEPFTTQFLENLQGGSFDIADRMFHSIASTWQNCLLSASDVKELIPELFYCPEFLRNSNKFDLGTMQNNEKLDDVVLPPWAKTPEEFIRIHREALESEYVSMNLPDWIDLIFGYKQTGKAAEKAYNLFYYLTYEGTVDIESIKDNVERMAIEAQIANFGQTPSQLLFHPHPRRNPIDSTKACILKTPSALKPHLLYQFMFPPSHIIITNNQVITLSPSCDAESHKWVQNVDPKANPTSDSPCLFEESSYWNLPIAIQEHLMPPYAMVPDETSTLIVCSKWDSSFRLVDSTKVTQIVAQHKDKVTCFAASADGSILVSGSKDSTLCIWHFKVKGKARKIDKDKMLILRGHDDEITCIQLSVDMDVCISGSKDGTIVIHTLIGGNYVRTIDYPGGHVVHKLALSHQGHFVAYSTTDHKLHLYDINGRLLCHSPSADVLSEMLITKDGEFLITSGQKIIVRKLWTLEAVHVYKIDPPAKIVSMKLTPDERSFFVGLETGRLLYFAQPHEPSEKVGHSYIGFA